VRVLRYDSGEAIQPGDHIRYHGERGSVEFVIGEKTGDPALDWYFDEYSGGVMIKAEAFGSVFLGPGDLDEQFVLVERAG
jgi:hypothetical protein